MTATVTAPLDGAPRVVTGRNAHMRAIFEFIDVIADGTGTVLVTGESGTGKDVIARLIHDRSRRRSAPFVAVGCAILNRSVIESELFGHERGAFTDAYREHVGRFEQAHGGTIFLDDIDDVPLPVQVKLLRVLQTHSVERIGGARPIPIDVRVIAGSKRDLRQMAADGSFRDDLFYRLNVLPIALPPLRERREDIPILLQHFLNEFFTRHGRRVPSMSAAMVEAFVRYSWPGNVRELENACERIAQTCTCGRVRAGCVPVRMLLNTPAVPQEHAGETCGPRPVHRDAASVTPMPVSLEARLRHVEWELLHEALDSSAGNKTKAAAMLRIKRSTLIDRLRRCRCYADVA